MQTPDLESIGRSAFITVNGVTDVPAKVDTGADSSSIWASNIQEADGVLTFTLFGPESELHSAAQLTVPAGKYRLVTVYSSSGEAQERFKIELPVTVEGRDMTARFTLADRKAMAYPVLLGRDFLDGTFLVDVSQGIEHHLHKSLMEQKHARNADRERE